MWQWTSPCRPNRIGGWKLASSTFLLHQLLDLLLDGGDLDVAVDDFAVGADQEHGGQDHDAVLVGERAFQAAGLEELNAGPARNPRRDNKL